MALLHPSPTLYPSTTLYPGETDTAAATLQASSTLTTAANLREFAGAQFSGSATLTVGAHVGAHAAALLGAGSTLTADGRRAQPADTILAATSTLGAAANLPTAGVQLTASGALTASGVSEAAAETILAAEGGLLAGAWLTARETILLHANAEMPVSPFVIRPTQATLPATSALVTNAGVPSSSALLAATAGLVGTAWLTEQAAVTLAGSSLLLLGGAGTQLGFADLGAQSALNVGPILIATEAVTFTAESTLGLDIAAAIPVAAALAAESMLASQGVREIPAAVAMTVAAALTPDASPAAKVGQVLFEAQTTLTSGAQLIAVTVAPLAATGLLVAEAFTFAPLFVHPAGPSIPQTRVPTTRLLVVDTITGKLHFELPYMSLSWGSPLNGIGKCSATLPIQDTLESVFEQGAGNPRNALREVLLGPYRWSLVVTYGNVALWGGPYLPSDDAADGKISIGAGGMEQMLTRRVLINADPANTKPWTDPSRDVVFAETTPAATIYRAVDHAIGTYNGAVPTRALPIVCTNPPPILGDETFTYLAYDLVPAWKAITDLVDRDDGPDIRLEPEIIDGPGGMHLRWDLQIGTPFLPDSGTIGPEGPLPWTFDDTTGILTRTTDAVGLASTWYSTGDGQDREKKVVRASTTTLTDLGFPHLEHVDSGSTSESELVKLEARSRAALAAHQTPTDSWSLKVPIDGHPPLGAVRRGEVARIDVRNTLLLEAGYHQRRITEVSGDAGSPMFGLSCEEMERTYVSAEPGIIGGTPDAPVAAPNNKASRIAWTTGENTTNRTVTNARVGGTDLGIPFDDGRGNILVAFGDTFSDTVGGQDWRSNVLARSRNTDYAERGIQFNWWRTDRPNHADQIIPRDAGGNDFTVIPTSGITIGTRSYITYFSIFEWGDAGRWRTNYAGYAWSDDSGQTWTKSGTARWQNNSTWTDLWQMNALVRGRGDGYVYMFGTPNGRAGSAYLTRVPEGSMLTMSAYQQLASDGTWVQWRGAVPPKAVITAPVGEMSVMYHAYYSRWLATYYKESVNAVVVHTAPDVTGPWSPPITVATAAEFPSLYGPFWHPWSTFDRYPVFTMTQWPPYNIETMLLRLDP